MTTEKTGVDINRIIISVSILLAAVIVSGAIVYTQGPSKNYEPQATPEDRVDISLGDGPFYGQESAPVKIVEFSDFQCPFCRIFWQETYPQLKSEYLDTGKAVLEYRDYPLDFHPVAGISAQAAKCAGDQARFWEMHDKIFSEQAKQGQNTVYYTESDLKKWASEIGLDGSYFNAFNLCLSSGKYAADVAKDYQDGEKLGVTGTPTFFINGQRIVGAQPFETFKRIIEEELKSAKK